MISNQSFCKYKLVHDRFFQNIWVTALFFVACLFAIPIQVTLVIQKSVIEISRQYQTAETASKYILNVLGNSNYFLKSAIIIVAVIMSWSLLSYMHSKRETDFYHSLPISRTRMFMNNFVAGNIGFLLCYIINLGLGIGVVIVMGFATEIQILEIFKAFFTNLVFFNIIFLTGIMAGILSGTKLIHVLMTGILLFYFQLAIVLLNKFLKYFFMTFYSPAVFTDEIIINSSAITRYFQDIDPPSIMAYALFALVLLFANLYIFIKRPSETAGKSIVSKELGDILEYMVLLLGTMGGGLIFYEIGQSKGWMIFGLIFSGIIGHWIIEAVLNFDFKKIFCHSKRLVAFGIIFGAVFTILDLDLINYDGQIPTLEQIDSVTIEPINFDNNVMYYSKSNTVKITNEESIKTVIDIAKMCSSNRENNPERYTYGYTMAQNDTYGYTMDLVVKYNLKNGKSLVRHYNTAPMNQILPLFGKIFNTQEFKHKYYPIFNIEKEDIKKLEIQFLDFSSGDIYNPQISSVVNSERINKILIAIQEDFIDCKAEEMVNRGPIGKLSFSIDSKNSNEFEAVKTLEMPIYHKFEKTLKILSEFNLNKYREITSDDVSFIKIYDYNGNWQKYSENTTTIIAPEEIDIIMGEISPYIYAEENPFFIADVNKNANVYLKGNINAGYGYAFPVIMEIAR